MENEYKRVEVDIGKYLQDPNLDIILKNLFYQYNKDDLYYELQQDKLVINLRKLNFWDFKKNIEKSSLINNSELLSSILTSIESIRGYGLEGNKRVYVGYNKERKVKDRKKKEQKRGTYFYAKDHSFSKTNNEVPEEYLNKVFCADSESLLKKLPDSCIDLVFTSPPYNFGLDYDESEDDKVWEHYFDKLFSIFTECIRVLKFGSRIIVNVQPVFSDYIPTHHIISNFFMQKKLIWKGEILWEENNYNCKYTAWGSWKSPSSPYLKYTWEFLEVFSKGSLKKPGKKENIDISADEFKNWVVAKWSIAPEGRMKEFNHPAMFPEELVVRALKLFSYQNDVVLDPFNGAGTTTYVAKRLNRRFIGVDISEEYCNIAKDRMDSKIGELF